MAGNWINTLLATIVSLLPITNPISTAALFLSLTSGQSEADRRAQALRGSLYTLAILLTFLVAGTLIMNFFGISIPGLRIAGGVMIIKVAWSMMQEDKKERRRRGEQSDSESEDISFTPLAMPSLSGPGAIAVTVGLAAGDQSWISLSAIIVGIVVVVLIAFITLRASTTILRFFGENGLLVLSKIMGFLLLCVGIQFILNGLVNFVADQPTVSSVVEGIGSLSGQAGGK